MLVVLVGGDGGPSLPGPGYERQVGERKASVWGRLRGAVSGSRLHSDGGRVTVSLLYFFFILFFFTTIIIIILFFSSILLSIPFGRVRMLQPFFPSLFSPFLSPQKPPHFLTGIHSNIFLSLITSILNVFSVSASHHHTTTYHIVSARVLEQIQLPKEEEKNCPRISQH